MDIVDAFQTYYYNSNGKYCMYRYDIRELTETRG
jgi:hypothetical protein